MASKEVKKKVKLKRTIKVILILSMLLIVSGVGLQAFNFYQVHQYKVKDEREKQFQEQKRQKEEEKKNAHKEYNLSMVMVGDALIHSAIYYDAKLKTGGYDFKPMLQYIKPIVQNYDLKYYNQETILGGSELGLSNYPRFNSPYEVGDAFIDAGFNLVSLATNHTMDKNEQGVINSKKYWSTKTNVLTAGSYTSFEDRDTVRILEKNGIKYAFFSYTMWNNGLATPKGKEYLNNEYTPELAKADIERVKGKCDLIIVAMHWGTEYSMGVSDKQEEVANYLSSLGVNIIIGAHPHVVEPIEYINNGKTLVIYSLGNFISDQVGIERLTGLMVTLNVKKVVEKQISTVTVENVKGSLLYTKSNSYTPRNFRVYPYSQLNSTILPNYKSYYEKYKAVVTSRYPNLQFDEVSG